ncbi:MAG: RNA polymerase sigma factor [Deltaproteobacteria bacterium]|nr:RNA polymerase sigma factor [Deltaproteobacteria bacterium]
MRTDEELMELYRNGSRDAFEMLFARHHRKVIQFAFRMTGDRAKAEEAAQETFLRIARAASTWQPTARFTTWMYTIARRTTLNFIRDEKEDGEKISIDPGEESSNGPPAPQLPGPSALNPEEIAWTVEIQERFAVALGQLPETYRSAFVLNRGDGLSYEEVASVLGITVQAVKSRIFRAREMLMESLGELLP